MQQLSYSDRSAILEIVEHLKTASPVPDDELLRRVSAFLLAHHAHAGFEHALTRDAIALSNHLRVTRMPEVQAAARAALRYLLQEDDFFRDTMPVVGLQDDAYVLSLALHEIAGLTGVPTTHYGAPHLTDEETKLAESQLERFVEQPRCADEALVSGARAFCDRIRNVAETGYLGRMRRNVELMIQILGQPGTSDAHLWSRGALSYLVCPVDVIPDDLGLVGFLDDRYILDTAMTMIQPQPDPWFRILDETIERWPFLNWLILSAHGTRHPLSEFVIANAALGLGQLGATCGSPQVGVVLPEQGLLPVLLTFIATLGMIQEAALRENASLEFQKGQKVLVDGKAVWIFDGLEMVNDRPMFRLTRYRRMRGVMTPSSRLWPVDKLARLRPTDADRATRGDIVYDMARNPAPIGSVDRLFHSERPIQFGGIKRQILSVANLTRAREIMRGLRLYGERLSDVIPMGSVTHDGDVDIWSQRWRGTEAVLLFVPGLDRACDFLEEGEGGEKTAQLIVDGNGAIARQSVSLQRVCKVDVPVLAITRERDHRDLELLSDRGFEFFEWEHQDLRDLLWPSPNEEANGHCVRTYERRLVSRGLASTITRDIPCEEAIGAYDVLRKLGLLRGEREDPIDELTGFVARAWELMCMLTQSVVPIGHCEALKARVTGGLAALTTVVSASRFMSTEERRLAGQVTETLTMLSDRLQEDNPKAGALAECLSGGSDLTLICHDAQAALETSAYWTSNDARTRFPACHKTPETIPCTAAGDDTIISPAVVVGWLGKRRIPELLHPPVSPDLTLLLYDFELAWYDGLQWACEQARRKRGGRGTRHRLLGSEGMWHQSGAAGTKPDRSGESEVRPAELDDFDDLAAEYRRTRAIAYARSGDVDEPDVDATIHWFANGLYAFLTSKYKAKVVTHLLEATASRDGLTKSEVRRAECQDLSVGDYLLFHRGSDADAIRVTADEILKSPDTRSTARLWQRALRRFRAREGLTPQRVWERLKAGS